MDKFQLPQGVGDSLPPYMFERYALEDRLKSVFYLKGYDPIDTSVLENANTYRGNTGAVDDCRLFQLKDTDGSLVALRADMTLPLSRIAATKLPEQYPLRLFYVSQSFSLTVPKNRDREFFQAGIELFGVPGAEADAEVIGIAIDALKSVGLKNFLIDVGQVGIVKGIIKDLSGDMQKEVVAQIDKKNLISNDCGLPVKTVQILNAVISLYGEEEVLQKAERLLQDYPESMTALCQLKETYAILTSRGLSDYISFDLGLVNSFSYYSGIVFKGLTTGFGASILGGGRYDRLLKNYHKNIPATGMAIGIRNLLTALSRQGVALSKTEGGTAVGGKGVGKLAAANYARAQNDLGNRASDSYAETKDGLLTYAKRINANRAVFFDENQKGEELL